MVTKSQAYVGEFEISLFPVSLTGKLFTVKRSGSAKETALKNVCPVCEEATPLAQSSNCPENHGPFSASEVSKAKEVNGKLLKVGKVEAESAKESPLDLNRLDLTVHPAEDVEEQTYPGANAYIFVPTNVTQQYAVLRDIVETSPWAFMGISNIKHHETLVRLQVWKGHLIVQQLLYPEDVNPIEQSQAEADGEFVLVLNDFITKSEKPFDVANYKNEMKARLNLLVKATEAGESAPVNVAPKKNTDALALEKLKELLAV